MLNPYIQVPRVTINVTHTLRLLFTVYCSLLTDVE